VAGRKVMVIGIDGGTWDALKPYIQEGLMPRLGGIVDGSAHGILKSVIPPVTAPAWVSFATGVNPGRHGCFNFVNMRSFGDFRPINASDIKVETFYETMVKNGYKCTLVNLPVSYPARIEGTVISSLLSMGDDFIHPPELIDEVPLLKQYRIMPQGLHLVAESRFPHDSDLITENEAIRFRAARELFKRQWDFFFVLFSGADWIQHRAFTEMMKGEGSKAEGARRYFAELDEWVGWFFDNAGEGTLKIIISDHGFRTLKGQFAVNPWLEDQGFLRYVQGRDEERHLSSAQRKVVGEKPRHEVPTGAAARVRNGLERSRATAWTVPVLRKVVRKAPEGLRGLVASEYRPDFEHSRVYYSYFGFYIREDAGDAEATREKLMADLCRLDREYDLFKDVARREDIYWGPHVNDAPALVMIDPNYSSTDSRKTRLPIDCGGQYHSKDGILVIGAAGEFAGKTLDASLVDICPTILDWMNVEPPHRFDGKSLLPILG